MKDKTNKNLTRKALELDKLSLGRLISIFEDPKPGAAQLREEILSEIEGSGRSRKAWLLGFTGSPGAGKSTLIGEVALRIVSRDAEKRVAVLAVDPSSKVSGGSLLGDRTRVRFPAGEKRLFFRSQASDLELGGVSRHTFQVCRLLSHIFDYVFIETVGIGQSEIEIEFVADRIYLVLQPLSGDQIQFMKAGIMEIPDVFILNKCDEKEAAQKSYSSLKASLTLSRPHEAGEPKIIKASALTGLGIDEILDDIFSLNRSLARHPENAKEEYFFEKWIRDEYGRMGLKVLKVLCNGASSYIKEKGSFDRAQAEFAKNFPELLARVV
jgi:LAO/AO transport system kinase